jgi:hypothetical protein
MASQRLSRSTMRSTCTRSLPDSRPITFFSIASSRCNVSVSFFVVSRSTSPMPPAAVASRRASTIASRSLSCSPRSSSSVTRMSRTGWRMSSGRIFCSERDTR